MLHKFFMTTLFAMAVLSSAAQSVLYELDASRPKRVEITPLPMKGKNPAGVTLSVNNRYFEKNGRPWFPVMGEFHFSRYPHQYWEEELQKMKSAGISIVATYVLWNGHEQTKGKWDWTGDKDLRRFIQLCAKNGLYVWLRVGPYCNAEQLYGGLPEWIYRMKGKRTNDPQYLAAARLLYNEIGRQSRGLYFQEGGPIIGVQLENEYASGQQGHIGTLKSIAREAGMRPVYFSVTANTIFDDAGYEAIPLQGAYPYRGWEHGGGKATKDFLYANDQWIMTDAFSKVYYDVERYPKGLCEQGCGSQMTWDNRFIVESAVVAAHLQNQLGRGVNFMGYYMFHGGTQMPGLRTPSCPESYDFQAPIGEFGLAAPSLGPLKLLHHFINDFGADLAPMEVVEPEQPVRNELDTARLRYVARVKGDQAYLFLCNTQVRMHMPDKAVRLRVRLQSETVELPEVLVKGGTAPILPVNLHAGGAVVRYATAQPVARFNTGDGLQLVFAEVPGMQPEIALDEKTVRSLDAAGWQQMKAGGLLRLRPQAQKTFRITAADGRKTTVVLLSRQEAENSWRLRLGGEEKLAVTTAQLLQRNRSLELRQLEDTLFSISFLPSGKVFGGDSEIAGPFRKYVRSVRAVATGISPAGNTVALPAALPAGLKEVFLDIRFAGGHLNAVQHGKTVTDHVFNGTNWMPGLARYLGKGPLTFEAAPWNNRITGVDKALAEEGRALPAGVRQIRAIPQYFTTFNLNTNKK